ncbi:hypothetical protein CPB83DRAFT_851029 [Crepidotus variabilis]|uniref:F-box domain-containing protein n=1 Tax=Crepidotus variabilis TaxID=179855 RepID=A0A9P6EI77_9AGAR|nr:hypothetical protein CPB83DRAFT_851029 [Crepidotus variabilis]
MSLKISPLSWRRSSRYAEPLIPESSVPSLPAEIWFKIIRFTTRLAGHDNLGLDDAFGPAFSDEEHPEIDTGVFRDRRHMSLVCSAWAELIRNISAEYLVVYSDKQLKRLVKRLEMDKNSTERRFGARTTRVDFKIVGEYNAKLAARLFRSTPNLLIYSNKNGPGDHPVRYTPHEVLRSLLAHCGQTLRRVDWAGPGEPPRYQDLAFFCNHLPKLTTLRLMAIYSYPRLPDGAPPTMRLPSLTTLSLGIIPEPPVHKEHYAITWDPLLQYLSLSPQQLPALNRFECDLFPQQVATMVFFNAHGSKLRLFRTTTCFADAQLPQAVSACSNLRDLVIVHGAEVVAFPQHHPTLERVCLLPTIDVQVDMPKKMFSNAVLNPLDDLLKRAETMIAPNLKEIRIRNVGGFTAIVDQEFWIMNWYRRLRLRRIEFVDQFGISYDKFDNRTPLDLVRC